ncbi:hypothetical protein [Mycetocola spongiae]|uniref:hypothetical protein n=1 Tax=Mycetocola spongiae TaxID=2859226 RepID=UPI001CF2B7B8|nr:hypothetical protein [Mycetocola spongiae]UCR88115.1 hypothetical protein KXZ72_08900 [Mycetocola spongiae]
MNRTPRALNRLILFFSGLVLLIGGVGAILVATVPALAEAWAAGAGAAHEATIGLWAATPIMGTQHSWMWAAVIAASVLLIAIAVLVISREGRGRTGRLLRREPGGTPGSIELGVGVAEDLLRESMSGVPGVVAMQVGGFERGGETAIKVSISARRGTSPAALVRLLEHRIDAWDSALGEQIPIVIEITGGLRTRVSHPRRAH